MLTSIEQQIQGESSPHKLKITFGASRTNRFPSVKLRNHEQIGYTLPSTIDRRAAGFGFGERFLEQNLKLKKNNNPSPDKYNIPTVFKPDNTTSTFAVHVKGDVTFCFGASRDDLQRQVIHVEKMQPDPKLPGPGTYNPLQPLGVGKKAFKLKGRLEFNDIQRQAIKKAIPGAGTYLDKLQINKIGVYNQNSEYNNSRSAKWSPYYDRFKLLTVTPMITPGPGTHKQHGELKNGNQVNSNFHSIKTPSFGIGSRDILEKRFKTPGPGTYRLPSDFGYIDYKLRIQNLKQKLSKITYYGPIEEENELQGQFKKTPNKLIEDAQNVEQIQLNNISQQQFVKSNIRRQIKIYNQQSPLLQHKQNDTKSSTMINFHKRNHSLVHNSTQMNSTRQVRKFAKDLMNLEVRRSPNFNDFTSARKTSKIRTLGNQTMTDMRREIKAAQSQIGQAAEFESLDISQQKKHKYNSGAQTNSSINNNSDLQTPQPQTALDKKGSMNIEDSPQHN